MNINDGHAARGDGLAMRAAQTLGAIGSLAAPLMMRIALALPFLRSGLTRWDPFPTLSLGTQFLFEDQFKLHLFGQLVDLPSPMLLAYLTACGEIVLPLLLLLGMATRFVAFGLLIMTCVIQLVVPEGWANFHLYWAALALGIMALGGGPFSLDRVLVGLIRSR